ncbi:phage portal protein family protein [Vibrio campbellii]|uniref:phage portal protein family protein n=1 Tax=Vibrio campbellii TaxID=680 RepID=UPI001F22B3CC|nr:DUF935 family protein [Vibrio campbellii]MCE7729618.1 DUF935 domain-containing protein [Vibrio campbellii]
MKNLTLFTNLVADLPTGVIENFYPQPSEIGSDTFHETNGYFGAIKCMMLDDQISSDVDMRHAFASRIPFIIEGSQADIANAKALLDELDLEDLILRMLTASEYGFRPVEIKWEQDGGYAVPVESEAKRPESFYIMRDGSVAYQAGYGEVKPVPEGRIIPVVREGSSDKPYGVSILESLWPIWQTKWINWANLERLGEKYAVPNVVALTNATDNTKVQEVANALAPLRNGDAAALAGVDKLHVLNAQGKVDEVLSAIKYIDSKITYRLTGQTLSSGNQEYGSRSMGEVHQMNALFYAKADAKMVFKSLNKTLFKWIFQANNLQGRIKIGVDEKKFDAMIDATKSGSSIELSNPTETKHLWLF